MHEVCGTPRLWLAWEGLSMQGMGEGCTLLGRRQAAGHPQQAGLGVQAGPPPPGPSRARRQLPPLGQPPGVVMPPADCTRLLLTLTGPANQAAEAPPDGPDGGGARAEPMEEDAGEQLWGGRAEWS